MALVCDTKSDDPEMAEEPITETNAVNEDLEDGEIEDDEEEVPAAEVAPEITTPDDANTPNTQEPNTQSICPTSPNNNKFIHNSRTSRYDRGDRHNRYDERKRGHLTEAEKSVMHLHKLERLEREKREKYKREQAVVVDDFASNIEKAIASVLKKDKQKPEDDQIEEGDKRGKKRKKKDKEKKKAKQRKCDSPQLDSAETNDVQLKMSDGIKSASPAHSDSYDSTSSTDRKHEHSSRRSSHSKTRERSRHNEKKHKSTKNREQKTENQSKPVDSGICLFYLQGKCNMGDDCLFSHDVQVPMKLELCKFYVMECCAKGDNCSYMHSTFPCKFYHMGLACRAGDSCKFAHGKPLNDGLKQILFKHIETAPKEILGEFPRLNRDGALTMLNQAQKVLDIKYGGEKAELPGGIPQLLEMNIPTPVEFIPKDSDIRKDKKERHRPSRWQDPEPSEPRPPLEVNFGLSGFYTERGDQDMRFSSNGDIDMRTLPSQISTILQNVSANLHLPDGDVDIRGLPPTDTDIRFEPPLHLIQNDNDQATEESNLEIVTEEEASTDECVKNDIEFPPNLPKKQRELFLRIQSQQKDTVIDNQKNIASDEDKNIDWYSDDDDDGRLMIKDDIEETPKKIEEQTVPQIPPDIKPGEVLEKLGDLSKIDISVEVTKLLSSLSQTGVLAQQPKETKNTVPESTPTKPDVKLQTSKSAQPSDPRKARRDSNDIKKAEKLSIYEQGSISLENLTKDVDLRSLDKDMDLRIGRDMDLRSGIRPDIDLRNLGLPFKPIQNYTPATEIDASIQSHPPISWRLFLVDIPQPNYSGLKLNAHDAKSIGDPRLRKIFRLSTEEKESPASPKETVSSLSSPKTSAVRMDPRLRKTEEKPPVENSSPQMNYAQQLNVLQASAFYQSLTSNQKLLLNQELADQVENNSTNANDPILNGILTNLGLIPGSVSASVNPVLTNINATANNNALNILANVNNMLVQSQKQQFLSPIVNTLAQTMVQQAPNLGIANLPPDFQLNFDPRQGGLLGNAPPFAFNDNSNSFNSSANYTDEYYDEPSVNSSVRGRGGRGGFRDRQHQNRRGRSFNSRHNNGNRNFRNRNRTNNNNVNNNRNRTSP